MKKILLAILLVFYVSFTSAGPIRKQLNVSTINLNSAIKVKPRANIINLKQELINKAKTELNITLDIDSFAIGGYKPDLRVIEIYIDECIRLKSAGYDWHVTSFGIIRKPGVISAADPSCIYLSPMWISAKELLDESLEEAEDTNWGAIGTGNIKGLVDHEFAHTLTIMDIFHKTSVYKNFVKVQKAYNKAIKDLAIKHIIYYEELKDGTVMIPDYDTLPADFLLEYNKICISEYGQTDIYEFVAECFSTALNAKNPSKYALAILKIMDNAYKA